MIAGLLTYTADALVFGALVALTLATAGTARLPGIYQRIHATGQAVFLSLVPLALALIVLLDVTIALRAGLLIAFLLLTTPVSAHVLAQAAWRRGRGATAQQRERE